MPALSFGKCIIVGRDYYSNIVPSNKLNAQSFVGVVTNYLDNGRIGARVRVSTIIAGGYEVLYQAPEIDSKLRFSAFWTDLASGGSFS